MVFQKSALCRTIHVDGAWGGLTFDAGVYLALYNQHAELPAGTRIRVGRETAKETASGGRRVVRQVEVEALMTPSVAKAVGEWLIARANQAEDVVKGGAIKIEPETNS